MIKSINDLLPNEQKWLAKTATSILLSDTSHKENQASFIQALFKTYFDEEPVELLSEIYVLLEKGIKPKIEEIDIADPDKMVFMLDILSASVFANGKRLHLETERYFEAGKKLSLRLGILSYRLSLEVEKERVKRKLTLLSHDIRKELKEE